MHCDEPGCLAACPAPGAIVQYANGIVDVNPDQCIGCGYCETGCPFDVPQFSATTGKMAKCTLCVDRVDGRARAGVHQGLPDGLPALRHEGRHGRARPDQRVEQLKANGFAKAALYDPPGVGGTGVVTVLAHGDHPEWYDLPARSARAAAASSSGRRSLRPIGAVAIFGAVVGAFAHYTQLRSEEGARAPTPNESADRAARA